MEEHGYLYTSLDPNDYIKDDSLELVNESIQRVQHPSLTTQHTTLNTQHTLTTHSRLFFLLGCAASYQRRDKAKRRSILKP